MKENPIEQVITVQEPSLEFAKQTETEGETLNDIIKYHYGEFLEWVFSRERDYQYVRRCVKGLQEVMLNYDIHSPIDLDVLKDKSKYLTIGLRLFLRFLEERKFIGTVLGFPIGSWLRHLKIKKSGSVEYYPTDETVVKWLKAISQKWDSKTLNLARFLLATGLRFTHSYKCLAMLNELEIIREGSVSRIPLRFLETSTKKVYQAFLPTRLAQILEPLDNNIMDVSYKERLNPRKWVPKVDIRMSAKFTRKWFINKALDCGVDPMSLRFIIGHATGGILEVHYLENVKRATREYKKVVKEIEKVIFSV